MQVRNLRFELTREFIIELKEIIESQETDKAMILMDDLHPADIAEIYDELNIDEAKFLFLLLDGEKASDVLAELEDDDRVRFLKVLPNDVIAHHFIGNMDSDDAADVLADIPEEQKDEILSYIEDIEQAGDIIDLMNYDEDTAGGLMAKELISVNQNWTVETCIEEMRRQEQDVDEVFYVYVVDNDNVLKGVLSLQKLIISQPDVLLETLYEEDIISVKTDMNSEDVALIMEKYDLVVLPVVDSIDRLAGRITIDDVVDVIREEADRDYQMLSGISEDVEPSDNVWLLTRARLPWLMVGMIGGIFGARVIGVYEDDLATNAALAFFLPLIAAMGGNVGVQSSAIVVQGLANHSIDLSSTFKKILKELSIASLNATTCALIVFLYNSFFGDSFALTVTVSLSLFIVIMFASIFGTFVPLALNKFKIDPALATGPFITTVNDILGLFIYLAIGRVMFAIF